MAWSPYKQSIPASRLGFQGVLVEYTPTFYSVWSEHNFLCHNHHNIKIKKKQVILVFYFFGFFHQLLSSKLIQLNFI